MMIAEPDVARIARTIGEPTRIRMLSLLMEGRALTAKELAYGTGVEPATATAHLQKLLADSLVNSRIQGRHKYFRLASPEVGRCVESLMAIAPPLKAVAVTTPSSMRQARFCYDHLAGELAIEITHSLIGKSLLEIRGREFVITQKGRKWLESFGLDLSSIAKTRRKLAPLCLDWSERKDHIGGALGALLAERMLEASWIKRERESRIVNVTPKGKHELGATFGIRWN
jgi:DNA-binding transcriptional ArsR family regulator